MNNEIVVIVTEDKIEDVFGEKKVYSLESKPRTEVTAIAVTPLKDKYFKLNAVTLSCHDEILQKGGNNEIIIKGDALKNVIFVYYDSIQMFT